MKTNNVTIIGAGPAGLATAALLQKVGIYARVLEQADRIGERWLRRYASLRLNSVLSRSGLPGYPIPQEAGRWPSRDAYVEYLERYVACHQLNIQLHTTVHAITPDHRSWLVETSEGVHNASAVIVATGAAGEPYVPPWPGRETFRMPVLHSSSYITPNEFVGLDVLVAGVGNSGSEIAAELSASGARRVRLAVRRAPIIVQRSIGCFSPQGIAGVLRQLPRPIADRVGVWLLRPARDEELVRLGFPTPSRDRSRLFTTNARTGRLPVFDSGFLDAVRAGRIELVAAVQAMSANAIRLSDGTWYQPDVVIAATGYRPGLEQLVGAIPGALDGKGWPRFRGSAGNSTALGLFFVGFERPLSGQLREIQSEATRLVRAIRRRTNEHPI